MRGMITYFLFYIAASMTLNFILSILSSRIFQMDGNKFYLFLKNIFKIVFKAMPCFFSSQNFQIDIHLLSSTVGDLFGHVRKRQPWADPKIVKVMICNCFIDKISELGYLATLMIV